MGAFPSAALSLLCPVAERLGALPALAVEEWLRDELRQVRALDRQRGQTSRGAGRSDFLLHDRRTGRVASEASTGQQKALLIGLILAHARLMESAGGQAPMLLLDEPLVHLDEHRREALLNTLAAFDTPVLLTGTDAAPFGSLAGRAAFVRLHDGRMPDEAVEPSDTGGKPCC
jgi:DNA replication and repair protein RecF